MSYTAKHIPSQEVPDISLLAQLDRCFKPFGLYWVGLVAWFATLVEQPLLLVKDYQKFRHVAFSRSWKLVGDDMSVDMMLGDTLIDLLHSADGVVLDIGPGQGSVIRRFDASKITRAYGPEPAEDMHAQLQENIDKAGLHDKYTILSSGAEPATLLPALARAGVITSAHGSASAGIFDTIVSTRVLCGVPAQADTAALLHRLLKPGGRLIVSEHVASPWPHEGLFVGWAVQQLYWLLGWNFWMGGCEINRDTVGVLGRAAGPDGWKSVDLQWADAWTSVPFVVGVLTK